MVWHGLLRLHWMHQLKRAEVGKGQGSGDCLHNALFTSEICATFVNLSSLSFSYERGFAFSSNTCHLWHKQSV